MNVRIVSLVALMLVIWGCYGYAVTAWLRSENERCQKFGNLYAECFAPQGVAAWVISIVLVIASLALLWLAVRR